MDIIEQLKQFTRTCENNLRNSISTKKKNIVIISYYPTYRSQFGELIKKLKKSYNVIVVVDRILNDDFEKSGHHCVLFPWRMQEGGKTYYINANVKGIDLILTADQVGYDNGKIDREFLNKSAKRIYFPHRLTCMCGASKLLDYIIVPSKSAMSGFKYRLKDSSVKLLPCGYPQFDLALKNYKYKSKNTITYAPTLRYADPTKITSLNAFTGADNNIIEWLLKNTNHNISYRAHPINYSSNPTFYQLIQKTWEGEKRVSIDAKMGNDFFNYSDFLVTDWSTTSFSYSYTTLRPSFFYMPYPLDDSLKHDGGYIIEDKRAKNFAELRDFLENIDYKKEKEYFLHLREENIYNSGRSVESILENIELILQGKL
ncbi:MAG: CDP-glycerol glycerophosphotransferase family protein [Helicobacter sp.]|nr:CDP-glycerol glycerophosphotransferase family protein [Helicobacteraceae bacterium]MDY3114098.1 CDP-glycerol glycerophosphotransferase family protein [Helicobacter sp.]